LSPSTMLDRLGPDVHHLAAYERTSPTMALSAFDTGNRIQPIIAWHRSNATSKRNQLRDLRNNWSFQPLARRNLAGVQLTGVQYE
jgi:hypothetical protein